MPQRPRFWRLAQAPALALVLAGSAVAAAAGCTTTTTTQTADSSSTTAAPATSAPPTTQDRKADERIAQKAVLTTDDLDDPQWEKGTARTDSSDDTKVADACPALADQLSKFKDLDANAPKSKSPTFKEAKQQLEMTDDVTIYGTEDDAVTVANIFGDKAMDSCLRDYLRTSAKQEDSVDIDPKGITLERTKVGKLGDDHAVFTASLPVTVRGNTTNATAVLAFIRVGRGYTAVSITSGRDLDYDAVTKPILDAAAAKLQKNLAS